MAVKANNAIRAGRLLIGTPYSELDCINFLKKIIRTSFGGVKDYTTAGTNALWDSYNSATKYKDLTWRQEGISGAKAGMLAFKRKGDDVHHVGLVTGMGTVLHSSSVKGRGVVETPLSTSEGWILLAKHRYIEVKEDADMIEANVPQNALYSAKVITQNDPLSVREWPETGTIIGKVPKGKAVEVLSDAGDGWPKIRYNELVGYASAKYLEQIADEDELPAHSEEIVHEEAARPVYIVDSAGNRFQPVGDFKVYFDTVD